MRAGLIAVLFALPALAASACTCSRDARSETSPGPTTPEPSAATPLNPPEARALPVPPPSSSAPAITAPTALGERTWHLETPFGPSDVVVLVPEGAANGTKFPVLVAFHGRGESLKGPKRGPRGWVADYALGAAAFRLGQPPLSFNDFGGMIADERLERLNASLKANPFRGLIVVCPFLPDILKGPDAFPQGQKLAGYIVDTLLPRVYAETPAIGTPKTTGVDGVSLGGRASLHVGLLRPEAFGTVGTLQPALDGEEAPLFANLAKKAAAQNPGQRRRLLTSDEDYFLVPTQLLSKALRDNATVHDFVTVQGPHNYEFNRGPGAYEMLLYHERVLRDLPAP